MGIFVTLVVSAVALKLHDSQQTEKALRLNRVCSRLVIGSYMILNAMAIYLAIR